MKTLSKTALISAFSIIAAATHVQADQRSIALSANVPGTCSIGTVTGGTNFTSSTTAFEATISNAKAISKIGQLTINYVCTSQTVALTLASANDGITGPIAGNGSTTTNKINYTAKLLN